MNYPTVATLEQVASFLNDFPEGVLVDVLPKEQYERQHIPGSKSACVFETVFLDRMAGVAPDKSKPVLIYGAGASLDVSDAACKLIKAGYADVRIFPGGVDEWRESGHALDGSAPEARDSPFPPLTPVHDRYVLDVGQSVVRWTGRSDSHDHTGSVLFKSGELCFIKGRGKGEAVVDMTSIKCADLAGSPLYAALIEHLSSVDFFNTALFPEAALRVVDLTPLDSAVDALPNYTMSATLVIKGNEQQVEGKVSVRNLADGGLSLCGQLEIDRTRWEVLYGSSRFFRFLGMHKVDDIISLDARMTFKSA